MDALLAYFFNYLIFKCRLISEKDGRENPTPWYDLLHKYLGVKKP
jgi:hypothetical protein